MKLRDCIWIRGEINDNQAGAAGERRALERLGIRVKTLKHRRDEEGLARIKKIVWSCDSHIILHRLAHLEIEALFPVFKDRRNFSVVLCDWWSAPLWFTENAEYQLYNFCNFHSVRSGVAPFARFRETPFLELPKTSHWYDWSMRAMRMGNLAISPALELMNWWRRRTKPFQPERAIYFPLAIEADDVPLRQAEIKYDFSNLGGVNGLWLMRDAYAPSYFTGANLYVDRKKIADLILAPDGPFRTFDVHREKRFIPWLEYCQITRESRFTLATPGLHDAAVPKFIESICLGTPVIGQPPRFEYPWLEKTLFPVSYKTLDRQNVRQTQEAAIAAHSKLRENCLNLRDELLKLYSFENILRMAQDQLDGRPIPKGYLNNNAA